MIATVLAQPADRPDRRAAQWRQLVDLLAQRRPEPTRRARRRGLRLAARDRARDRSRGPAPVGARAGRPRDRSRPRSPSSPRISPSVAAPLIAGARLDADAGSPCCRGSARRARALLRHRERLDPRGRAGARRASARAISCSRAGAEPAAPPARPAPEPAERANPRSASWSTGSRLSAGSARGAAGRAAPRRAGRGRGLPLGDRHRRASCSGSRARRAGRWSARASPAIAGRGQYGVDGQAAGAFEKRAPFRDARFSVAGERPGRRATGGFRACPSSTPRSGSFLGYRGTARRPRLDEVARERRREAPTGVFGTEFPADSLRQLIHELRTPLNAIIGFAEMIDGQYMGPAAAGYRGRAADDHGAGARPARRRSTISTPRRGIETRRLELDESAVDAVALLVPPARSLRAGRRASAAPRSRSRSSDGLPRRQGRAGRRRADVRPDARRHDRPRRRRARRSPRPWRSAPRRRRHDALPVDRPARRRSPGSTRAALLDPGYSPDGDWPGAPALGLGFALRLVRNLAEAVGGALIDRRRPLPALSARAEAGREPRRPRARRLGLSAFGHCRATPAHGIARGGACSSTVEPAAHNGLVAGSNPAGPTSLRLRAFGWRSQGRGVAQPGSASALGAEGRRFESCLPDHSYGSRSPAPARSPRPASPADRA